MQQQELIPGLFRTEYRNIVSVLCYLFGIEHIETAEDLVSDTFLAATESWSIKGIPDNPTGWLYTVAKNKTRNYLKKNSIFEQKLSKEIKYTSPKTTEQEVDLDLSPKNIADSQLAMIFTVCNPSISNESQIALALNLLCGFGIQEIADAFLTNKEVIYKRLNRAKERLKEENLQIRQPSTEEIAKRQDNVLATLYLLFSEGYYSTSQNTVLRKDLCEEAMRLTLLLIDNPRTNSPQANALLALMYFHASRFEARIGENGETIIYEDQDESLWDNALIEKGVRYLNLASTGNKITKYHLEAGIAYWHTRKEDSSGKWESILDLYNMLLILEYSPIAALNRTYALAKTQGKKIAIPQAEKLGLENNPFYHSLLGYLYTDIDNRKAIQQYRTALELTPSEGNKTILHKHIRQLEAKMLKQ